jgi:hypothetical protein
VTKATHLDLPDGRTVHCYDTGEAGRCPDAELWLRPDDGRVSVLSSRGVAALDWLVAHA